MDSSTIVSNPSCQMCCSLSFGTYQWLEDWHQLLPRNCLRRFELLPDVAWAADSSFPSDLGTVTDLCGRGCGRVRERKQKTVDFLPVEPTALQGDAPPVLVRFCPAPSHDKPNFATSSAAAPEATKIPGSFPRQLVRPVHGRLPQAVVSRCVLASWTHLRLHSLFLFSCRDAALRTGTATEVTSCCSLSASAFQW